MNNYELLKNEISEILDASIKLSNLIKCQDIAEFIANEKKKLLNDKLVIMTIGEARQGKSSLLGQYLNDPDLFPVDLDVTTCLITIISYGEKEEIAVISEDIDGNEIREYITRDQIELYAKEQNKVNRKKNAKLLSIQTPNEKLKDGLVFVDSPGIGSLNAEHSELTFRYLPYVNVVLFVSDASSQLTVSELNCINSIYDICKNIIFVMTKKDIYDDDVVNDIIEKNKKQITLNSCIPDTGIIYIPVSSNYYKSYKESHDDFDLEESNFDFFDSELKKTLFSERPHILFLPKLINIILKMEAVDKNIKAIELSCENNKEKIEKAKIVLKSMKQKHNDLLNDYKSIKKIISVTFGLMQEKIKIIISDYKQNSYDYIKEEGKSDNCIKYPNILKNTVIEKTEKMKNNVINCIFEEIGRGLQKINENYNLNINYEPKDIQLCIRDEVVFTPLKKKEVIFNDMGSASITRSSNTIANVGTVIGGAIGCFVGNPIAGVAIGRTLGRLYGSGVRVVKNVFGIINQNDQYNREEVIKQLINYVDDSITSIYNFLSLEVFSQNKEESNKKEMLDCVINNIKSQIADIDKKCEILQSVSNNSIANYQKNLSLIKDLRTNYDSNLKKLNEFKDKCSKPLEI